VSFDLGDVASGALTGHGGTFHYNLTGGQQDAPQQPPQWIEQPEWPCDRTDMPDHANRICPVCGHYADDHPAWVDPQPAQPGRPVDDLPPSPDGLL
jgi:hypothetical protein